MQRTGVGPGERSGVVSSGPRRRAAVTAGLVATAAGVHALQIWGGFSTSWHWDDLRNAIPATQILAGVFPVHQVGVEYFGAAGAYPLAAWFALAGASTAALDLFCLGLATTIAWTGYLLARRLLPPRAALLAGVIHAVPPLFLARWAMSGNLNYPLNLLIGNLILLATHRVFFHRARRPAAVLALGLLAGVGWWNNPMVVVFCAPFAVLALRTGLVWRATVWLFALGLALGGLPDWTFEVAHFPSARLQLHEAGSREPEPVAQRVGKFLGDVTRELIGVHTSGLATVKFRPPWAVQAALLGVGLAALLRALVRDRGELRWLVGAGGRPGTGLAALWALVVALLALTLPTERALRETYFLPLYALLPIWLGELLGWLWARRRLAGALATAGLVGFYLVATWTVTLGRPDPERRWAAIESRFERLTERLNSRGVHEAYYAAGPMPAFEVTFLSGGRLVTAAPWDELVVQHGWQVDARPAPPLVLARPWLPAVRDSLRAVGYGARESEVGQYVVVEPVPAVTVGFAPLAPDGWALSASHRAWELAHLLDRDAATQWSTGAVQAPGQWLAVDLGRPEEVARLDLLTIDWQEVPTSFRVEWSPDGATWHEAVSAARYWGPLFRSEAHPFLRVRRGRVQAVFGPVRARFLRVTQTGRGTHAWSARELFVYRPAPPPPPAPDRPLVADLRRQGVSLVYASHWLSARVLAEGRGAVGALDSNINVNSYGRKVPDPVVLERFRLEPGHAVLLGRDADAPAVRAALAAQGALGREGEAGGYPLLLLAPPASRRGLPADGWRAGASAAPGAAARAIDGRPGTRWIAEGTPAPDAAVTLDLGAARPVGGIRLRPGSGAGNPSAFVLEGSADGATWSRLGPGSWAGPLYWTGYELLRNGNAEWAVTFPPATVRHLRVRPAAPGRWWAIAELELLE
jgi:hypothetical protein